jgi:hypothetical protein
MLRPNGETINTKFTVFVLTWPGLEPTIYRTRGEHANHYTNDAVCEYERLFNVQIDTKETALVLLFYISQSQYDLQ